VVFLQHTRESRVAIGTARIAHVGLAGSELHEGIDFSGNGRVQELVGRPGTALLFPGPGAMSPDELRCPPETLLVIDGTWPQARKLIAVNPVLGTLPRIGFMPRRPGNYRIRREPARHCVATVEAVVEVLAALERDEARFAPMLRAFESMVDRQIAAVGNRVGPPRRREKGVGPWWESGGMPDLDLWWRDLVGIAGEANAHHRGSGVAGVPEMVQLAAVRMATGERFHAFVAPRRPLAPHAAEHLGVAREQLLGGESLGVVMEEWRRFVRPEDRLVGWGGFSWELLAQEGWRPEQVPIDLRLVAAHRFKRRPGTSESAALALGGTLDGVLRVPGRAGRSLRSIEVVAGQLRMEIRSGRGVERA
jgi:DTW domain-containing protein YfiP